MARNEYLFSVSLTFSVSDYTIESAEESVREEIELMIEQSGWANYLKIDEINYEGEG